jgi:hypothetical protein
MIKVFTVLVAWSLSAAAQAPSAETLNLSLRTVSKALASCHDTYARVLPGHTEPLLKIALGAQNYDNDLTSLGHAEKVTLARDLGAVPDRS